MDFQMNERKNDIENQLLKSEEEKLEKMRQEKYFKYKRDLKNYEYNEQSGCKNIFKTYPNMFTKNKKDLSKFEKMLISVGDNSAIISMVLRKFETAEFLKKKINLKAVMEKHETNEANIMNLFSLLMFDWHDQIPHNRRYNLIQKFKAYKEVCPPSKSLFDKIFQIFDAELPNVHHVICMKIIYYYFEEKKLLNEDKSKDEMISESTEIQNLIGKVLQIKDSDYKIQILKILYANLPNTKDEEYKNLVDKIKRTVKYDLEYSSVCKISYTSVTKHCDELFFNLLDLLKKNLVVKFKIELEEFIEINKKFYGEFWTNAIKTNARILYHTACDQNLIETQEYILITIPNVDIKAPVTSMFKELSEFYTVFNEPLEKDEKSVLKYLNNFMDNMQKSDSLNTSNFKKKLKNTTKIRRLIFGRKDLNSESFFEKFWSVKVDDLDYDKELSDDEIFRDNQYLECVYNIWNEFRLWEKPEILILKNPKHKDIFNYVIEKNNDKHLRSFLMPTLNESKEKRNKSMQQLKHYMVLKNSLFYDYNKYNNLKCLIDFHFKLIEKNIKEDPYNLDILFYLFEEIGLHSSEQEHENAFIEELFEDIMTEDPEKFDAQKELKLPRKHFLIGIMMIYWKQEGKNLIKKFDIASQSSINKSEINNIKERDLYFGLLSTIMNKEDKEFLKDYKKELEKIESRFKLVYNLDSTYDNDHQQTDDDNIFHFYEKYSTNFNFVLLYAAIKTNQPRIVDEIFKYNNFLISCPTFPINMEPDDIHYHTAIKFLENRYELERNDIPDSWIRHHNFKKFLDSRITSQNDFYKIDCRFLLPYFNFEENKIIDRQREIDEDLLFNEDYGSMEYILEHHGLKSLVTHPVMETIINLKIQKYDRILFWNFLGFVLFYIIPTIFLTYFLHSKITQENINSTSFYGEEVNLTLETTNETLTNEALDTDYAYSFSTNFIFEHIINLIRIVYIFSREYFQYRVIYEKDYFKSKSNITEIFLIFLPIILSIGVEIFNYFKNQEIFVFIGIVEATNIIIMVVATALLYSTPKFSAHLRCYKKITLSYMSVFLNFFPLFIGLAGLTLILFDNKVGGEESKIFQTLGGSLMKLIVMYSGEIGIEPDDIALFLQRLTIALIIIILINKANLIISIAVNDIQTLMHESRQLSLIDIADKYVAFAKKLRMYYAFNEEEAKRGFSTKFFLWLIGVFIKKYPYIHRLQSIYVDKLTHNIFIDVNIPAQKLISGTRFWTRWFDRFWISVLGLFKVSSKSIEDIHAIVVETRQGNRDENTRNDSGHNMISPYLEQLLN